MRSLLALAIGLVALSSGGCDGGEGAKAPSRPLPAYGGHTADLFDDSIDPAAVGLDMDNSYHPKTDASLRERAQTADAVLRVKVTTVTGKKEEAGPVYEIGFKQVEVLGGEHPPGDVFTIKTQNSLQTNGIMKNFEGRLVGMEFTAFLREFTVNDQNDHAFHAHLSPSTKDVKEAVGDAIVLRALK